ncbi:hypothetical protein ED312_00640 [Sinomicrobium pectinilyticum]|uniref:Uncharacterized protein n=1 Tax=Sinomicrobium pectinilyticum TaxID=1084421 RepID=A0A3N0F503_SINP1|nr:hypothetical protein ED312_00640 [Sinomicrobium pectinilyticum]
MRVRALISWYFLLTRILFNHKFRAFIRRWVRFYENEFSQNDNNSINKTKKYVIGNNCIVFYLHLYNVHMYEHIKINLKPIHNDTT